jgi:hypothetical protein
VRYALRRGPSNVAFRHELSCYAARADRFSLEVNADGATFRFHLRPPEINQIAPEIQRAQDRLLGIHIIDDQIHSRVVAAYESRRFDLDHVTLEINARRIALSFWARMEALGDSTLRMNELRPIL